MRTARSTYYCSLPTDGSDVYQIIQKAVDMVANSSIYREVQLPQGYYQSSKPILIRKIVNGEYKQVSVSLRGSGYAKNTGRGTTLHVHSEDFGVGIQQGRACEISDFILMGDYGPDGNPGDKNAPHTGVIIDPTGGPDSISTRYKIDHLPTSASSTCNVKRMTITGFQLCYGNSINGITQMGEMCHVEDISIGNSYAGLACGGDQQKQNNWKNIQAWERTNVLFSDNIYGRHQGGHINIEGVNIAGGNIGKIFDWNGGRFPLKIRDVFGEQVNHIGNFGALCSMDDSHFDFNNHGTNKMLPVPDMALWATGATPMSISNTVFRHYTEDPKVMDYRLKVMGNVEYEKCTFNAQPFTYWENGNDPARNSEFTKNRYYYDSAPKSNSVKSTHNTTVSVDKSTWSATVPIPCEVGDYLVVKQDAVPIRLSYRDYPDPTFVLGRVVDHDGTNAKVYFLQSNCPAELNNVIIEVI